MFSWKTSTRLKINGIDGLTPDTLRDEIARGGKFVIYSYNFSAVVVSFKRSSDVYFIRPGQNALVKGLPYTGIALVFGWWGIPWGLIYTVMSLHQNLTGGEDVTDAVMASLAPPPPPLPTDPAPSAVTYNPPRASGLRPPPAPKAPFNPRPLLIGGGVLLAILGLLAVGAGYQKSRHLPVALLSGLNTPYDVMLNGTRHHLRVGIAEIFSVPEGKVLLEADLPNGVHEKQEFTFEREFFSRFFTDKIAILNPDSASVVYEETITYTHEASSAAAAQPAYVFHVGETSYFLAMPEIVFADFPEKIDMPVGSSSTTKTRLHASEKLTPLQTASLLKEKVGYPAASRYLTTTARFTPVDESLLTAAVQTLKPDDGLKFFQTRLAQRPALLEWHRYYQQFAEYFAPQVDVLVQYRAMLAAEPANGDLLYLLGRAESDHAVARSLFERAIAATPPCTYAYAALGFDELSSGRYARALELFEKAESKGIHSESIRRNKDIAFLGLHRFEPLLKEAAERRQANPDDLQLVTEEIRLTVAANQNLAVATKLKTDYLNREKSRQVPSAELDMADHYIAAAVADTQGRIPDYILHTEKMPGQDKNYNLALLRGNLPAVEKILADYPRVSSQAWFLLYIAATRASDQTKADLYFGRAVKSMTTESKEHKQLAASLTGDKALTPEAVCALSMYPEEKRTILTALGLRQPANREIYFQTARLLNIDPGFPGFYLNTTLSL